MSLTKDEIYDIIQDLLYFKLQNQNNLAKVLETNLSLTSDILKAATNDVYIRNKKKINNLIKQFEKEKKAKKVKTSLISWKYFRDCFREIFIEELDFYKIIFILTFACIYIKNIETNGGSNDEINVFVNYFVDFLHLNVTEWLIVNGDWDAFIDYANYIVIISSLVTEAKKKSITCFKDWFISNFAKLMICI